ncbi:MAG: lysophospholipid acyltransferase family protein [Rubrivivax sp.]
MSAPPVDGGAAADPAPPRVDVARAGVRVVATVVHALHGLAIVLWAFPRLDTAGRQQRIGWWAGTLLHKLGLEHEVRGQLHGGAVLIAANHLSWIDVLAIHAVCPRARFVAKAEVRRWPLINRLVASAGTLYLEREKPRDAVRVVHGVAAALQAGDTVAVFPEGTTGDGCQLLPFHANLLQAAIASATPVQPVALRYTDARHATVSPSILWLGDTTLIQSLWQIARADRLRVELQVLPALAGADAGRRALAQRLRDRIGAALADPAAANP